MTLSWSCVKCGEPVITMIASGAIYTHAHKCGQVSVIALVVRDGALPQITFTPGEEKTDDPADYWKSKPIPES